MDITTEAFINNLDDFVADGLIDVCDDCGEIVSEHGQCHPYCPNMLGDVEVPEWWF